MKKLLLVLCNLYLFCTTGYTGTPLTTGTASFYGFELDGRKMANGKPFDPLAFTCASWFYPLGTHLQVENMANGRVIIVEVTDRGPAKRLVAKGRIVDLSFAAFKEIGQLKSGLIAVSITKL